MSLESSERKNTALAVQRAKSEIYFYENVPIVDDFKQTILFTSKTEQDAFFNKYLRSDLTLKTSYQRVDQKIRTPFHYEDMLKINYVKVVNPSYEWAPHAEWYWFVDNFTYVNDKTLFVSWSVDVLQTFMFHWDIPACHIVQGHINEYKKEPAKIGNFYDQLFPVDEPYFLYSPSSVGAPHQNFLLWESVLNFYSDSQVTLDSDDIVFWVFTIKAQPKSTDDTTSSGEGSGEWDMYGSVIGVAEQLKHIVFAFDRSDGRMYNLKFINVHGAANQTVEFKFGQSKFNVKGETSAQNFEYLWQILQALQYDGDFVGTSSNVVAYTYTKSIWVPLVVDSKANLITLDWSKAMQNQTGSYKEFWFTGAAATGWKNEATMVGRQDIHPYLDVKDPATGKKAVLFSLPVINAMNNSAVETAHVNLVKNGTTKNVTPLQLFYESLKAFDTNNLLWDQIPLKLLNNPFITFKLTTGRWADRVYSLDWFHPSKMSEPIVVKRRWSLGQHNKILNWVDNYQMEIFDNNNNHNSKYPIDWGMFEVDDMSASFITSQMVAYMKASANQLNQARANAQLSITNLGLEQQRDWKNQQIGFAADSQNQQNANSYAIANTQAKNAAAYLNTGFNNSSRESSTMAHVQTDFLNNWAKYGVASAGIAVPNTATLNQNAMDQTYVWAATAMWVQQNTNQMSMENLLRTQWSQQAQLQNTQDTAQKIAQNNYDNAIAKINAGLADQANHSNTLSQQGANVHFDFQFHNLNLTLQVISAPMSVLHNVARYYWQFGYDLNSYDKPMDFIAKNKRKKFNYIKTSGVSVRWGMNLHWQNCLRAIFESGVTFWHDVTAYLNQDVLYNYQTQFGYEYLRINPWQHISVVSPSVLPVQKWHVYSSQSDILSHLSIDYTPGYEFSHFSTDVAGSNHVTFPHTMNEDFTIYAQAKQGASTTLTFQHDANIISVSPTSIGVPHGHVYSTVGELLASLKVTYKPGYQLDYISDVSTGDVVSFPYTVSWSHTLMIHSTSLPTTTIILYTGKNVDSIFGDPPKLYQWQVFSSATEILKLYTINFSTWYKFDKLTYDLDWLNPVKFPLTVTAPLDLYVQGKK